MPPKPPPLPLQAGVVAGAAVIVGSNLTLAVRETANPAGLPNFDIADYTLRALRIADALRAGDGGALADRLLEPDVHPVLHPAVMGLGFLVLPPGIAGACTLALIETAVALVLLVLVGHLADRRVGALAGATAAALVSTSPLHRELAAVPMTEPLALVATLGTLALALRTRDATDVGASVGVGVGVLLAGLVRYNLAPMLLLPLLLDHAVQVASGRRAWRDPRVLGWIAPTAIAFAAWEAARPGMHLKVLNFFRNVDSGLPPFSRENLLWLPTAFAEEIAGVPALAAGVAAAWGVALLLALRRRDPELLLHLFVVVAAAALAVHRYKLGRNLHVVAPVFYLAALLPLWRLLARSTAASVVAAGLGVAGWLALRDATEGAVRPRNFRDGGQARVALDLLADVARANDRVVVAGAHRELNEHMVTLWLRERAPRTELLFEPPWPPTCVDTHSELCATRLVDASVGDGRTALAVVSRTGGGLRKAGQNRRDWTRVMARQVEERIGAAGGYEPRTVDLTDGNMLLTVYVPR